jgi:ABC-type glycerol-3-phosphate transport system substrate-binding protein
MRNLRSVLAGFIGLVLLSSFTLSGCSGLGGTKIKISSWGSPEENQILVDLLNDFQKKHPNIQVELERIPYNEYTTKLLTEVAGGLAPDVIFTEVAFFSDFYLRGVLQPLNPYIQKDHLDLSTYYPQVVDRYTVDGQTYVIPRDTAPICVVFYNKNAFDEMGVPYPTSDWTIEDFVATAKKVMKRDSSGKVTRWGLIDDWVMPDAWIYDFGGSFVDNIKHPTKWTFATDPNTLKGMVFRSDMIYKYKIMMPPASLSSIGGAGTGDLFTNGTEAMFLSGIWKTPSFRQIKNFKWDVVMLPKGPGGVRGFGTGGSGYGILTSSPHKDEAWELVKFISGQEGEKKLAQTGLAQPALMAEANTTFLDNQDPKNKKMLLDAVQYVKYPPMCKNWSEVYQSLIVPELDKVWSGTETVEEAMTHLKPQLEQMPPQTK